MQNIISKKQRSDACCHVLWNNGTNRSAYTYSDWIGYSCSNTVIERSINSTLFYIQNIQRSSSPSKYQRVRLVDILSMWVKVNTNNLVTLRQHNCQPTFYYFPEQLQKQLRLNNVIKPLRLDPPTRQPTVRCLRQNIPTLKQIPPNPTRWDLSRSKKNIEFTPPPPPRLLHHKMVREQAASGDSRLPQNRSVQILRRSLEGGQIIDAAEAPALTGNFNCVYTFIISSYTFKWWKRNPDNNWPAPAWSSSPRSSLWTSAAPSDCTVRRPSSPTSSISTNSSQYSSELRGVPSLRALFRTWRSSMTRSIWRIRTWRLCMRGWRRAKRIIVVSRGGCRGWRCPMGMAGSRIWGNTIRSGPFPRLWVRFWVK